MFVVVPAVYSYRDFLSLLLLERICIYLLLLRVLKGFLFLFSLLSLSLLAFSYFYLYRLTLTRCKY